MLTFAYFTSPQDWLIVGLIVLVLFGGTKIPQLAKGFGEGIREFKRAVNTEDKAAEEKSEEKSES